MLDTRNAYYFMQQEISPGQYVLPLTSCQAIPRRIQLFYIVLDFDYVKKISTLTVGLMLRSGMRVPPAPQSRDSGSRGQGGSKAVGAGVI